MGAVRPAAVSNGGAVPGVGSVDRRRKLPDYRLIPSVQEILLIDPSRAYADLHRRFDGARWLTEIIRDIDAALTLESIPVRIPLRHLCADLDLAP